MINLLFMCISASAQDSGVAIDQGFQVGQEAFEAAEANSSVLLSPMTDSMEIPILGTKPTSLAGTDFYSGSALFGDSTLNGPGGGTTVVWDAVKADGTAWKPNVVGEDGYIQCFTKPNADHAIQLYGVRWKIPVAGWPGTGSNPAWVAAAYCRGSYEGTPFELEVIPYTDPRPRNKVGQPSRIALTAGSAGVPLALDLFRNTGATPRFTERAGFREGMLPAGTYMPGCSAVRSTTSPSSSIKPAQVCQVDVLASGAAILKYDADMTQGATTGTGYCFVMKLTGGVYVATPHKVTLSYSTGP